MKQFLKKKWVVPVGALVLTLAIGSAAFAATGTSSDSTSTSGTDTAVASDQSDGTGTQNGPHGLAGSFNVMADKMQSTVWALRRFVADAAHELGTPLTALETDLELAQGQRDEAERTRLIDRALGQANRINQLSANLLLLSRLDTGTASAPMKATDLVSLVHQVADSVASRAEQAGIDLAVNLPTGQLQVVGHVDGLQTALENLVDNALKFTAAGGSVEIGAQTENRTAVVYVSDTGIGIPDADMEDLFSRFHRGRNVSAYPGNGLGLAIVKATMDIHGGSVTVASTSEGSRFELRLPLI